MSFDHVHGLRPLPPRARGKRRSTTRVSRVLTSTPACAGQTHPFASPCGPSPLYPRVRGANFLRTAQYASSVPLPPRARGKLSGSWIMWEGAASTPACAGQTASRTFLSFCRSLYPRVRGANPLRVGQGPPPGPLPARARGKRTRSPGHPASGDLYPRVRGANYFADSNLQMAKPLPPRARGKQPQALVVESQNPSTPACAGQTLAKPHNTAGSYSRAPRFSFSANPLASSGTRHTPSKTTGPATASSKTTVK